MARFLGEQSYVEVCGHHDADGITAASLVCHALWRRGIGFRLRVADRMPILEPEVPTLLCDLGAGIDDLPANVAVIDHHAPVASGEGPVLNPHLDGLDGERVLATAALAYGVANRLADCRDLAGLAAAGVIGDGQAFEDENAELLNEGIANGVLEIERGLALPGGSIAEQARARDRPVPPRDLRGCGPGPRAHSGLARRGRSGSRPPPLARRARHGPGGGAGSARIALGRPGPHAARARSVTPGRLRPWSTRAAKPGAAGSPRRSASVRPVRPPRPARSRQSIGAA